MRYAEQQHDNRSGRATLRRWLSAWLFCCFAVVTGSAVAQIVLPGAGLINTVAGNGTNGYSGDGGTATSAELSTPDGVAVDTAGNIYIADTQNCRIRKVTASTGTISTVAGNGTCGYAGDGKAATSAELFEPSGVAVDSANNIYIADWDNSRIRKITVSTGIISTVAGNGTRGFSGDGGKATSAKMNSPFGVALDSAGNIYIADVDNYRIRKVTVSTGIISTVAGNGTAGFSGDGGKATSAELQGPSGVAVDTASNIYIADSYGNRIRKVTASTGIISTVAGNGNIGHSGDGGPATSAQFYYPYGVAVDAASNIYIADSDNYRIRKITASTGIISTVAGNGTCGYSGNGGVATSAELCLGFGGVAVDGTGNVYIADQSNERTRAVGPIKVAPTITWATPAPISYGTALSATQLDASTTVAGTFAYSPPSGTLLNAGSQTLSVTFTPTDLIDYSTATATVTLTITPAMPTITWAAPAAVTYGTALSATQLDATANVAGTFVYSPAAGTVLGAGTQTLSVTFTPTNTNYAPTTGTVPFTVNKAPLKVTVQNASRAYGAANPTFSDIITSFVNGDTQSVVSGTASLTTTATASSPVGTYPITAALGTLSAANYTFSTFVNGTLTITQASPSITWATPAAVTYGTALSATQLDATANVAGTFVYSPAAGTVLAVGMQTLSLTFTPTDTTDYTTATGSVPLVVNPVTTTVTLTSSANPSAYGSPVTFTATVTPITATGTATFTDGSTTLGTATISGGVATYSTSTLSAGSHSIAAAYSGDSNDSGSTSSVLIQTVTTGNQLNTSRYQHSATLLNNGKVLIAGGVNCPAPRSCTYLKSAELYDPAAGSSVTTGSLGTPRVAPSVLLASGKVLIAGGSTCTSGGSCASLSSAEIYDPVSGTFAGAGNMAVARDGHTMTMLPDGKVLIAGGETCSPSYGGGSENRPAGEPLFGTARLLYASFTPIVGSISCSAQGTAEIFDPTSGSFAYTSGSLNIARYNAAAVRLADGRVLIVGGSDEHKPLWSTEIYEESADSFSELASGLLTARSSPVAALLNNGLVLVTGGSTCEAPTCPTHLAELYDPIANAFQYTSGAMNVARVSHTASLLTNGQVVLAGGNSSCQSANSCTAELSTESYDPASGTFTSTQSMTAARSGHTGTLLSNGSVLLAGGIASGTTLSSIESYQPSSLTPTGLVSIAVTPANGSMGIGGLQQYTAIGTFSNGSTSALQSVVWVSSNPAVASINNAASSSGFALGLSFGSTTITATAGTSSGSGTLTVQLPVQSGGMVTTSGQMQASLYGQTATELTTGQVLIAGGMSTSGVVNRAELYTAASQSFAAVNAMNVARWWHTATLLNDGTVLITGGSDLANKETLDSAEIYNLATGTFTLLSSTLNTARVGHTATLLNNGQVLIVGGYDPDTGLIADAELYDPPTQTFIDLGDTNAPRYEHTATMLQNGQVLIAGGETDSIPTAALNQAEIFDQPSQTFKPVTAPMISTREGHAAVLLNNGQVLITAGDVPGTGSLNTAEIFDPTSNTFTAVTSLMTVPRISHTMTVLNGGKVLITGGATDSGGNSTALYAVEFYDPVSRTFTAIGDMASAREHQTASLLNDGTVLVAGGTDGTNIFNSAELYTSSQLSGLTSIAITPVARSVGAGASQRFSAVGTFSDGSTQTLASVLWSSSSAAIAAVSGDATNAGVAASAAQGTTTIAASAGGVSGSATLTVTTPTLVLITVSPQGAILPLGATQQFAATGVYTDGSTQDLTASATWSSSATVVAVINSGGVAAGLFQGTANIQASVGSLSASTTMSVGAPALVSIAVSPATATIALGTSQQYQATGTYSDGSTQAIAPSLVAWSSGTPAVAAVNSSGFATTLSQGTATLTGAFESFSTAVSLTVAPPSLVSISVIPNAASIAVGATQQLNVTGNFTDGSTQNFTSNTAWASSNPGVIGVSSAGLATAVATGNATITATAQSMNGTAALVVTTGTIQANLNTSRYQHSATILNSGQILVAGGVNCPTPGSCTYLSSAELYNPATSAFTYTSGAMATARSAPAVQLNSGKVLIAGGYTCDGSGNCSILSSTEIYDPTSDTFSSAGTMTVARSGHTMTVLSNGTVLIAGGQNCNPNNYPPCSAMGYSEIYDPVAGTFTATANDMSAPRYGASAVLLNSGSVLIVGGFDGTNFPAAAEIYNPTYYGTYGGFTGAGPNLNVPRFYGTATLLNNGQVLVGGGSTCALPGCPTNDAEVYDPVANTFSTVAGGMNVSRFNHTATLATNGDVVVAGGYSSCGSPCTGEASTEFFDPVAGSFNSGQPGATALAEHTATLLPNSNVLLIGGINAGVTLASDEWYQPTSFTPMGLVSVTVAPASLFLMPGQTQQLVATGTFNDGSTQTLQSVIWNSSNPSAAVVGNSPGGAGIVNALATGATTLSATAGDVGGSASLSVAGLVSLAITPANPTITVGLGQQFTATGTFSDGSQQNVTTLVTWSSSNTSVLLIGSTSGLQGYLLGVAAGTSTVTTALGSTQGTALVTVQAPVTPIRPDINTVSPPVGEAGTQVTISGTGFGTTQGTGTVWLGSTYGGVLTWTDTQIVATVAAISQSGTARVQQNGLSSNSVAFNVNTATISTVSPTSGVPGTQVTISGSGFGTTQGSGQVFLGTASGIVQSWSDGQVVAVVAAGSKSGNAQILQNGVMSNAVPFAVNSLHIASMSPNSGGPGTSVTITGTGFGWNQGNGSVWLGGTNGQVMSWSNNQVVAVVAPNALTGVVRIEQNGVLSNALTFTVPTSNAVTLNPNMLNLVTGQTQTIQALNPSGQPVTGLTWASSNPKVVSLSPDDPPVLTALTAGHVTVTAGTASADVTVYYGTLPTGSVIWSNPGDGSGVAGVTPAVPSASGAADVFAMNGDCNVQALTSSGTVAWTANVGQLPQYSENGNCNEFLADFQGGVVVKSETSTIQNGQVHFQYHLQKLDGMTGQAYPAYNQQSIWWINANFQLSFANIPWIRSYSPTVVHTDGTIFTVDGTGVNYLGFPEGGSLLVDVIDPLTGQQKAQIGAGNGGVGNLIVAGDGYAYLPYVSYTGNTCPGIGTTSLDLLRMDTSGGSSSIPLGTWNTFCTANDQSGTVAFPTAVNVITNADQGVLVSWELETAPYSPNYGTESTTYYIAATSGGSVIAQGTTNQLVQPVLQAQDGSFYGTTYSGQSGGSMVKFDRSGNIQWSVPNDYPQIATADGGVVGASGITYDNNGRATGQIGSTAPPPINCPGGSCPIADLRSFAQSWTGNEYVSAGSVDSISAPPVFPDGASFWPQAGGNPSGTATAFLQCPCLLQSTGTDPEQASDPTAPTAGASRNEIRPADSGPPLKTYVLLAGDPGLNLPGHVPHNVGNLFNLAAQTAANNLNAQGNLAGSPQRVSSVQDIAAQLTGNGPITGGVMYFGHGVGFLNGEGSQLSPGEGAGQNTNVTADNVRLLSNAQLGPSATITLSACYAGYGRNSIAQMIANRLQRRVNAPVAGTFFSINPNATAPSGDNFPNSTPIYMIQESGTPFKCFLPGMQCQ